MAKKVPSEEGKRIMLVLDSAIYHKSKCMFCWCYIEAKYAPV